MSKTGGDGMAAGKKFTAGKPTRKCDNPDQNGNRKQRRAAKKIMHKTTK